jgi:hypothetical protein
MVVARARVDGALNRCFHPGMTSPARTAAIEHWDGLLAEDESLGDALPSLREWMLERGLRIDDRPLCTVLRPHLVAEEELRHQSQLAERVIAAIYKVRDALLSDRGLHLEHLGKFRDWIGDLIGLDQRPIADGALMRLDASLARTQLHFIELNADTPQGMGHNDALIAFFERLDTYERFAQRYRVRPLRLEESLLETLLAIWGEWGGEGKPTIGVVTRTDDPVRTSSLEIDVQRYAEQGLEAELVDFRELSFDRGRLRHGDRKLDLVHRVMTTAECLQVRDEVAPLLDAVRDGAVCMVNSFRSELLGHKAIFALLTDPDYEFGLSGAERPRSGRTSPGRGGCSTAGRPAPTAPRSTCSSTWSTTASGSCSSPPTTSAGTGCGWGGARARRSGGTRSPRHWTATTSPSNALSCAARSTRRWERPASAAPSTRTPTRSCSAAAMGGC